MKDRCHVFIIQKNCNPIFTKSLSFVEKYLRYEKSFPYKENVVPTHVRQSVYKSLSLHQFLRCNKMQFHVHHWNLQMIFYYWILFADCKNAIFIEGNSWHARSKKASLFFKENISQVQFLACQFLNLWVDFTKVLFEEKSVLRMQLNRAWFLILIFG